MTDPADHLPELLRASRQYLRHHPDKEVLAAARRASALVALAIAGDPDRIADKIHESDRLVVQAKRRAERARTMARTPRLFQSTVELRHAACDLVRALRESVRRVDARTAKESDNVM